MNELTRRTSKLFSSMIIASIILNSGGFLTLSKNAYALTNDSKDILADASFSKIEEINPVDIDDVFYQNIEHISSANSHILALDRNGHVFSQGKHNFGQLGGGRIDTKKADDSLAFDLTGMLPKISQVYAFENISFFQAADGRIFACGDNAQGQLGLKDEKYDLPTEVKGLAMANSSVKKILYSNNATFFLMESGDVYACGDNSFGWFGTGKRSTKQPLTKLNINNQQDKIVDLAAGNGFVVAISGNGNIYFAGDNSKGQSACNSFTETNYSVFVKLNASIAELDEGCYHKEHSYNGFKIYAGGDTYAVAPGCSVDTYLSGIYKIAEGKVIYPELFVFNLSSRISDDMFLGAFKQPFQTKVVNNNINCKKITNFSVKDGNLGGIDHIKSDYIYSVDDVYLSSEFMAILGKGNKESRILSLLGVPDHVGWEAVDKDRINYFVNWIPQDGFDGLSLDEISFANDFFIAKTEDMDGITRYLIDAGKKPEWLSISDPYLNISKEEMDTGYFLKTKDYAPKVFLNKEVELNINREAELNFQANGNTNISFKSLNEDVCKIIRVSEDKRQLVVKGMNAGQTSIQAVEFKEGGKEKILDMCNITVPFDLSEIHPTFDKSLYQITEGTTSVFNFKSDVENLDVTFEVEDKNIVKLDHMQITAMKPGITKLFAKYQGKVIAEASIVVSVYSEDIKIISHDFVMAKGEKTKLLEHISVIPTTEKDKLVFESKNAEICKLNQATNEIEAISAGEAVIVIKHPKNVMSILNIKVLDNSVSGENVKLSVSKNTYNLKKNETTGLDISISPMTEIKNVHLKSLDEKVCTVDSEKKTITAVNEGETYVEITHPAAGTLKVKVNVYQSVKISTPSSVDLEKGEGKQLYVDVLPISEKQNISYRSSDTDVCKVTQDGYISAISKGKAKILILYKGVVHSEVSIFVSDKKNQSDNDNKLSYTIGNTLDSKGYLNISMGETTPLYVKLKNSSKSEQKSKYAPKLKVVSGNKYIEIKKTDDPYRFDIIGIKKGKAVIEIDSDRSGIKPLRVDIRVDYLEVDSQKATISSSIIQENDSKETKDIKKLTRIEKGTKSMLSISGYSKIDLKNYFDEYFRVLVSGESIKYEGNGVIKAVKPGISKVHVRDRSGEYIGSIRYWVPYPKDYFMQYPSSLMAPKNKTINVGFNKVIKASSITEDSVFIQSSADGNGENLKAKITAAGKNLAIDINTADISSGKYYIFLTEDVLDINGNELISPIMIPITISE